VRLDDVHLKQPHRPFYLALKSSSRGRKEGPGEKKDNDPGPAVAGWYPSRNDEGPEGKGDRTGP
jgi:hypothetical protein